MRHRFAGRQLSRTSSHRRAMRRNMAASLIQYGAIRTTEAKAKELRRYVEKLITTARKGTLHARRRVLAALGKDRDMFDENGERLDQTVVEKLFDQIAPGCADRPGGYTRIIRLSDRRIGDGGVQVLLQLVEEAAAAPEGPAAGPSGRKRRAAKRRQAAEAVAQEREEAEADETPVDADGPDEETTRRGESDEQAHEEGAETEDAG